MAKGSYNHRAHQESARGRAGQGAEQIFTSRELDPMLDPRYKRYRECFMVPPYDHARPIKIDLDLTGSMHTIPTWMVTDPMGLPGIVAGLYPFLTHPQVMTSGIGNAKAPNPAPLQLGHFEGEGHKMDEWLTKLWREGASGGPAGESYDLGFFAAARMVNVDAFKRGLKGFHFTIADEEIWDTVRAMYVKRYCGIDLPDDIPTKEILAEMAENWHAWMIAPDLRRFQRNEANWRKYFGDNVVGAPCQQDVSPIICGLTGLAEGTLTDLDDFGRMLMDPGSGLRREDVGDVNRIIAVLEPFAATYGAAGPKRPTAPTTADVGSRQSGNQRV